MTTTKKPLKIIKSKFALVATGNGTSGYLLEGQDLQDRANANLSSGAWRDATAAGYNCPIYERNIEGYALYPADKDERSFIAWSMHLSKESAYEQAEKVLSNCYASEYKEI